jgi:N-formylglutamate amidohydrolase
MGMTPPSWPVWALCHLPTASAFIPAEARAGLRLSAGELAVEQSQCTAHRVADLFARELPAWQVLEAPCSPLVVDFTRSPEEQDLADDTAARLLGTYYHPHQAWFAAKVALVLAMHGRCLVVNASTFPDEDSAFEVDEQLAPKPDVRIGGHPRHTPPHLIEMFAAAFHGHAWSVQFAPVHELASVPPLHEGADARVHSVSIELNRRLYWNESAGRPNARYEATRERLAAALGAAFSRLP